MIKRTNKDSIKIQTRKNTNSIWIKIILVQKSAYHTRTVLMATLAGKRGQKKIQVSTLTLKCEYLNYF